jgi:inward rectifier potassium channel
VVRYVGLERRGLDDSYHRLLTMPFAAFIGLMALAYLLINALFALLYMLEPGSVAGARPGNFGDYFFVSVQTLGSLGYGAMGPQTVYAHLLMTFESFVALFNIAIATGLMFARISRPTARIMFSNIAVIAPFDGVQALMFRAANQRRNMVVEAEVSVNIARDIVTSEGLSMRRFYDLAVVRPRTPLFFLTWQVIHRIDADSPLYGETPESLAAQDAEILVVMKGVDETFASTIHARGTYGASDIVWGRHLADIIVDQDDGGSLIDFTRFHDAS